MTKKTRHDIDVNSAEFKLKAEHFLDVLPDAMALRDWIKAYLDIDLPFDTIDPDSNSNPIDALWSVYDCIKHNKGDEIPGFIYLSAREAYKTLGASILEVILLIHFKTSIAHMAAIDKQSQKAVSYINNFFRKLQPYLDYHGWKKISDSKTKIQFVEPGGMEPYITVIICTAQGANCISGDSVIELEDGSTVRAVELQPGSKIKTWDYLTGKDVYVSTQAITMTKKHARKIKFSNGSSVIVSDDHLMFTQHGWVFAEQVDVGDRVKTSGLTSTSFAIKEDHCRDRTLEQLILGTLLGDSSIQKLPSGSCRYQTYHCEKQNDYTKMIASVFRANGIECSLTPCKGGGYKLMTKTHPIFKEIRDKFYLNGKKHVTREWLDMLKVEGLAYWFMDDGNGNYQVSGKNKDKKMSLATCSFSIEEHETIKKWFEDNGIQCNIGYVSNSTKKRWPIIQFDLRTSRAISEAISPFFIPSMRYKLLTFNSRNGIRLTLDTGVWSQKGSKVGLLFENSIGNTRKGRKLLKNIKSNLTVEVLEIELMGLQELVDLHIDTNQPNLRSFYANGIFMHNSEHVPIMFVDEIDVVRDPSAYEEAKLIPGIDRGIFPITVKLSTRKYAFGLMQSELDLAKTTGEQIKRWNVLDITERCPPEKHLPEEPKQDVYVAKSLPFKVISEEQYEKEADPHKWEKVSAFKGCMSCDLLPVCKTRLASKPEKAAKGLYRPIKATINSFKRVSPEMGEAQLLCWKPSTKGLVYGRFEPNAGGNTVSVLDAAKIVAGDNITNCTMEMFVELLKTHGYTFYAGLDWGFTHESAFVVFAKGALGPSFIVDCFAESGLELADFVEKCVEYQKKYPISKWFCDQAQPSHIKTLSKALKAESPSTQCPDFTKDVMGGIEAIRSQIITTSGVRKLLVLDTEENQKLIQGFKVHHFKLDARGNPTTTPDDEEYADIMDCVRYVGQNIYSVGKGHKAFISVADGNAPVTPQQSAKEAEEANKNIMLDKISELTGGSGGGKVGGKKGKIVWGI